MDNIDFLPERIKAQRAMKRRLLRQGYLLGLCAVALVALGYIQHRRVIKAQGELEMLADREQNIRSQLEMREMLQRQEADLMIMKRIEDQFGSRINPLDILSEIERILPESTVLTSFNLETMEYLPAGASETSDRPVDGSFRTDMSSNRVRLVLTGLAPNDVDVANFIGQLSASAIFEDVNMGYAKNVTFRTRNAREFQASCYVVR